jgi:hypothetical protein
MFITEAAYVSMYVLTLVLYDFSVLLYKPLVSVCYLWHAHNHTLLYCVFHL